MRILYKMRELGAIAIACNAFLSISAVADDFSVFSPDKTISLKTSVQDGKVTYSIHRNGKEIVTESALGLKIKNTPNAYQLANSSTKTGNSSWKPVVGKRAIVQDRFEELTLSLKQSSGDVKNMDVVFRVYDEGVAFRYVLDPNAKKGTRVTVDQDQSQINFTDSNLKVWSVVNENRPKGPEAITSFKGGRKYPVVMKSDQGYWLTVTEAALHDFDNFDLYFKQGSTQTEVRINRSSVTTPFSTPWRVIMIANKPQTFLDSDLLVNLSPPTEGDYSWVKPGLSLWDWRVLGYTTPDGYKYNMGFPAWKKMIDFAAENEIPYLLLDANWYGKEHSTLSDPFKGGKAAEVKKALDYGKQKGVGLILYLNDRASVNFKIEEIAKAYSEWGAVGIKYGFMKGGNQQKVQKTERVVRACAANKLFVNFHDGPVPPTGHERTWPHFNTREYIHAQTDAHRTHSPSDFVHMAYVHAIAGPVDGNHGLFDYVGKGPERPTRFGGLFSTITAEAARTLVLYSGLTVLPDSPEAYAAHPELFSFICAQKQPWQESMVLDGEFGKWISVARLAKDNNWLVATATDEEAREIEINLDFLKKGTQYEVTIFRDADDAHYKTNKVAYKVEKQTVTSTDRIKAKLAPGGGHGMIITEK